MKEQPTFTPRGEKPEIEEGARFQPKFDDAGLIPCITQDVTTGEILMFAFMNAEALKETIRTGIAHYYSRSRRKLWKKGESSGHLQRIEEIRTDCDQDVVLIKVKPAGPACHVGYPTCFYRKLTVSAKAGEPVGLSAEGMSKVFDPDAVYGKNA